MRGVHSYLGRWKRKRKVPPFALEVVMSGSLQGDLGYKYIVGKTRRKIRTRKISETEKFDQKVIISCCLSLTRTIVIVQEC